MDRYEYRILQTDMARLATDDLVRELNELGAEGWGVVATVPHERHGYSREVHLLLARVLQGVAGRSPA